MSLSWKWISVNYSQPVRIHKCLLPIEYTHTRIICIWMGRKCKLCGIRCDVTTCRCMLAKPWRTILRNFKIDNRAQSADSARWTWNTNVLYVHIYTKLISAHVHLLYQMHMPLLTHTRIQNMCTDTYVNNICKKKSVKIHGR